MTAPAKSTSKACPGGCGRRVVYSGKGRVPYCPDCWAAPARASHKECPRCDRALPMVAFHHNAATRDGRAAYCRACVSEYKAEAAERRAYAD